MGVEGFREKIPSWWTFFQVSETPAYILASKLKLFKEKLKEQSKENKENWKHRKEETLNSLCALDLVQDMMRLTKEEMLQTVHLTRLGRNTQERGDSLETEIQDPVA